MTTPPRQLDRLGASRAVVFGLFLFSGVSGLVYEIVWSRMFALVLGTTVYAVATVLAVFMGGLALGSWLFGKLADRPGANGVRIYGWLELIIGLFAIVLPSLMKLSDVIYRAMWPAASDSFVQLLGLRIALAVMILIVPATMMGGTLPVLSRFLVRSRRNTGREIGLLYAINTLGAMIGCFIAGFYLLELLGIRLSLLVAAGLNFAVGAIALYWSRRVTGPEDDLPVQEVDAAKTRLYTPVQVKLALILYAVSGFGALALEVLWMRSLLYFTSVDTWAFTAMLSAFLCGLGLGSLLMSPFVGCIRHPLAVLAVIELLIAVSAAASIPLFRHLHEAYSSVADALPDHSTLAGQIATKLFASFFIMLVPTLLMGAAFPLASTIYVGAGRKVGRGIGTLYALNTVGAIGGSVVGGFLLIPALGLQRGILLCASMFALLGLALLLASPRTRRGRIILGPISAAAIVGLVVVNVRFTGRPMVLESWFFQNPGQPHELVFEHEGPAASLIVLKNPGGTLLLNINGITTAINNHMDMLVHRMLSHLPMLLHTDPEEVLIVGFGMGSTPWGCCQHERANVDVVELLRDETRTATIFEDINHGVLNHEQLNFIVEDGRNYLLATRKAYDVISFNAIHPRFSANLYTKDFYQLCRERMTSDGVICAWLTQNSMTEDEFRMLCRSFVDVFPNSSLWYCNPEHFCLVGTIGETVIDLDDWRTRMAAPGVVDDLMDSNLDNPHAMIARYMFGGETLRQYVAGAPLNTDDKPSIEFARETKDFERPIIERLDELRESAWPIVRVQSEPEEARARVEAFRRSMDWLVDGQIEHWYPIDQRPLLPEIAYRRGLLECPDNQDVRHNLVFSQTIRRAVEEQLDENPANPGALTRMATILMEEGRLDEARDYLIRALKAHNGFVPAANQLGLVELLCGQYKESSNWLGGVVIRARIGDPRSIYALSIALDRRGLSAEAATYRNAALRADPDVEEWFTLLEQTVEAMKSRYADTENSPPQ